MVSSVANAQIFEDVNYLFNQKNNNTARSMSLANSIGAIGGDAGVSLTNPAGLALMNHSYMTFTTAVYNNGGVANYFDTETKHFKSGTSFDNFSLVFPLFSNDESSGWYNINFGFVYNKSKDYDREFNVKAINNKSTMLDFFMLSSDGIKPPNLNDFDTKLAYDTYLTNVSDDGKNLYSHVIPNYGQMEDQKVLVDGRRNDYTFSLSANYENMIYFGGGVNWKRIKYNRTMIHKEYDVNNNINDFKDFTYTTDLSIKGKSLDMTLGAIFKPNDNIRIGVSMQTPTRVYLDYKYQTNMKSNFDNGDNYDYSSYIDEVESELVAPMKYTVSAAYIFGKKGFINIDYENSDFSAFEFKNKEHDGNFNDLNDDIKKGYKDNHTIRVGGEYRLGRMSLRAGYGYSSSPFAKDNLNADNDMHMVASGVGFNFDSFFIDFAYSSYFYKRKYDLYYLKIDPIEPSVIDHIDSRLTMTLGFRF